LLSFIRFPHAEDVTIRATRRVANYHHAPGQQTVANDSDFTIVSARIFDLKRQAGENDLRVPKVQTPLTQAGLALVGIEGYPHLLL
jgi:hypothetical protein